MRIPNRAAGEKTMTETKPDPPADAAISESLRKLEENSRALKEKIDEERRRHDMPIDSKLGSPDWEEKAKDGRFDRPAGEDDDE
jgi:hypothetical protein